MYSEVGHRTVQVYSRVSLVSRGDALSESELFWPASALSFKQHKRGLEKCAGKMKGS